MSGMGRFRGVVFEYKPTKGFGFLNITHELINGEFIKVSKRFDQVFCYHKCIEPKKTGFKKLLVDQVVEFTCLKTDKGLASADLDIIGEGTEMDDYKEFTQSGDESNSNESNFNQEKFNK